LTISTRKIGRSLTSFRGSTGSIHSPRIVMIRPSGRPSRPAMRVVRSRSAIGTIDPNSSSSVFTSAFLGGAGGAAREIFNQDGPFTKMSARNTIASTPETNPAKNIAYALRFTEVASTAGTESSSSRPATVYSLHSNFDPHLLFANFAPESVHGVSADGRA